MRSGASGFHPPDVSFMADVSSGRWVEGGLDQTFATVGSLMPSGFAAYVRLFHPARGANGERVRWADVAEWSGRTVHPLMAFDRVKVPRAGSGKGIPPWRQDPLEGTLDRETVAALAGFLRPFAQTSERSFFAIWEGYGQFTPGAMSLLTSGGEGVHRGPPKEVLEAERIRGVGRNYVLYAGPISSVTSFFVGFWSASPNIWWPQGREWCVATDIDLDSTYVGGSEDLIQALLEDVAFEALPIELSQRTYVTADTLNADGVEA